MFPFNRVVSRFVDQISTRDLVTCFSSWSPRAHLHVVGMFDINQLSLPNSFYSKNMTCGMMTSEMNDLAIE